MSQDYVKSITPAEPSRQPPPAWKRPPEEWERDRIELAKLDYGKHALRYQEVPPYFETSQGMKRRNILYLLNAVVYFQHLLLLDNVAAGVCGKIRGKVFAFFFMVLGLIIDKRA